MRKKFEYLVKETTIPREVLKDEGKRGWELVNVLRNRNVIVTTSGGCTTGMKEEYTLFFKRPYKK